MSGFIDKGRKLEGELPAEELVKRGRGNHIWLNALTIVRPSPQTLEEIGRMVIRAVLESDVQDDKGVGFPVTYIRVNAS